MAWGKSFVDSYLALEGEMNLPFCSLMFFVFWSPREECICAQTLLLQLLQSCFSVLQSDPPAASEEEKPTAQCPEGMQAAKELYTHLCDGRDWGVPWMWLYTGDHLAIEVWGVQWPCEPERDCGTWTCLPSFLSASHFFFFLFFLENGFYVSQLASYSLSTWEWPWISDLPVSAPGYQNYKQAPLHCFMWSWTHKPKASRN